jgi:hypothetical protein
MRVSNRPLLMINRCRGRRERGGAGANGGIGFQGCAPGAPPGNKCAQPACGRRCCALLPAATGLVRAARRKQRQSGWRQGRQARQGGGPRRRAGEDSVLARREQRGCGCGCGAGRSGRGAARLGFHEEERRCCQRSMSRSAGPNMRLAAKGCVCRGEGWGGGVSRTITKSGGEVVGESGE